MSDPVAKKPTWQDVLDLSMIDPVVNMVVVAYRNESREEQLVRMVVALSQSREDLIKRWTKEKMEQVVSVMKMKLEEL